jgi:hypothetical protein
MGNAGLCGIFMCGIFLNTMHVPILPLSKSYGNAGKKYEFGWWRCEVTSDSARHRRFVDQFAALFFRLHGLAVIAFARSSQSSTILVNESVSPLTFHLYFPVFVFFRLGRGFFSSGKMIKSVFVEMNVVVEVTKTDQN